MYTTAVITSVLEQVPRTPRPPRAVGRWTEQPAVQWLQRAAAFIRRRQDCHNTDDEVDCIDDAAAIATGNCHVEDWERLTVGSLRR